MADPAATDTADSANQLPPSATNASRRPHDDGKGQPASNDPVSTQTTGRDIPPTDKGRGDKDRPESPWLGGG